MSTTQHAAKEAHAGSTNGVQASPFQSPFHASDLASARALGQRYAVALSLSVYGAEQIANEDSEAHRQGDVVIVYSDAVSEAEVRDEFSGWGLIVAVASLRAIVAADAVCDGCLWSVSEVGPLTVSTVKTKHRDVRVRYCVECKASHDSVQRAIANVRAFRSTVGAQTAAAGLALMER